MSAGFCRWMCLEMHACGPHKLCAQPTYVNAATQKSYQTLMFIPICCFVCHSCSKLGWFLPRHTTEERRQLLDSCLNTRLLSSYLPSSSSPPELSSNQV